MKQYKDLNDEEKLLFTKLEHAWLNGPWSTTSLVRVLGILINKHKRRL